MKILASPIFQSPTNAVQVIKDPVLEAKAKKYLADRARGSAGLGATSIAGDDKPFKLRK
jgi:hypothetical protein